MGHPRARSITIGLSAILVGALAGAGCGSTTTVTRTVTAAASVPPVTVTVPAATSTTATSAEDASSPAGASGCDAKGISGKKGREGICTENGVTVTVVNPGHEARLHTLAARFNGCRQASSVSDGFGQSVSARGVFALCSITVRNRSDTPQTFDGIGARQTTLVVDGKQFSQNFDAENQADAKSFITQDSEIQPGESRTGDVVFDLQPRFMRHLGTSGNLFVVNFGDDLDSATDAAVLRTYG
jgi:Domain of unknown function (DUF4352)